MATIRKADASAMDAPQKRGGGSGRAPSPATQERLKQQRQFSRMIDKLSAPDQVFEVRPAGSEKASTVRQRLLKVAGDSGKEIAVRKHGNGFLVGLMTAERRSNRGRRRGSRNTATSVA